MRVAVNLLRRSQPSISQLDGPLIRDQATTQSPGAEKYLLQSGRRWLTFAIVATALFMAAIDQTIVAVGLRPISAAMHTPLSWAAWTITAYGLGQVVVLPVAGRVSDVYGQKKIFLWSVLIFSAASLACGMASNIYLLIVLRAVQAVGGAAFMPSATGIVAERFGRDRDRGIGLFTSIYPLGGLVGPVIGAVVIQHFTWRAIFLINVPIGLVLALLGLAFLPSSVRVSAGRPDMVAVGLLAGTLLLTMYGVSLLGSGHQANIVLRVILAECAGGLMGYGFARRAQRADQPIIPIGLLRQRHFATLNLISLLYGGCTIACGALVPLYAEIRYNMHVVQAGSVLTARAVGSVLVAAATTFMLRRIGYRMPMVIGFFIGAGGYVMLVLSPLNVSAFLWLALGTMVAGLGSGMSAPATNNAIASLAPDQIASVAALRSTFRQIGGMLAISVTTAVVASSANQARALEGAFFAFALICAVVVIPLTFTVELRRRGRW